MPSREDQWVLTLDADNAGFDKQADLVAVDMS